MKRTISLVLCLTLILGLLTGVAAGENGNDGGSSAPLVASDNLTNNPMLNRGMGFWLSLNGSKVVQSDDVEVWLSNDRIGKLFYQAGDDYPWGIDYTTGYPGETGYLRVKPSGAEEPYSIQVSNLADPMIGLYTDIACTPAYYVPFQEADAISFKKGQTTTLYVRADKTMGQSVSSNNVPDNTTVSVGDVQEKDNWKIWPVTFSSTRDVCNVELLLEWVANGSTQTTRWELCFDSREYVDMAATPKGVNYGDTKELAIEYDNKTYYLRMGELNGPEIRDASGLAGYPVEEAYVFFAPYFYWKESLTEKEVAVNDPSVASALMAQLDNDLSIHLYAGAGNQTQGPEILSVGLNQDQAKLYPCIAGYVFNQNAHGKYILTLEKADGTVVCCSSLEREVRRETSVSCTTVQQANEVLSAFSDSTGLVTLVLDLEGTLEGTIIVPESLRSVAIRGNGNAILKGSIQVPAGPDVFVNGVTLKGNKDNLGKKMLDEDTPNAAIYGTSSALLSNCTIEDYYYGVYVDENNTWFKFGAENCIFRNNEIGIYMDYDTDFGGLNPIQNTTFQENDTAIWIEDLNIQLVEDNGYHSMNALEVIRCKFLNNNLDIQNNDENKEVLWIPMSFFLHSNSPHGVHSPADKNANCWQPKTDSNFATGKKHEIPAVIASPVAVSHDFTVNEAGELYFYPKHIYVSDDIREAYPIDALEDGMAVTAVDANNAAIATVELNSTAPAVEPTAARAGTYSLRRLAAPVLLNDGAAPESMFDSVMNKTETASQITLEIGAIPEGYAGTVSVPCDFAAAEVYHDGKLIESTLSDGFVSFDAVTSSEREEYVIKKVTVSDDTPVIVPDVPAKKEETEDKPDAAEVFDDVSEDDWFCEAVSYVTDSGLMKGVGEGEFAPEARFSRAMMWTMLARLDGADTEGGENWYDKGLAWAKANGVSDGSAPNGSITREQLVTMLWRAAGEPEADETVLRDAADGDKISDYAREAMAWAVEQGVISGRGNGVLAPQGTATRAEVAQFFYNYLAKAAISGGKSDAL